MSQRVKDFDKSFTSTADLSDDSGNPGYDGQWRVVKIDVSNDESIVIAPTATDPIVGVCINKPQAGSPALIQILGTTKCIAGGTITRGDRVTVTTGGEVITTTSSGNSVVGIACQSAVSGDIFEVLLTPGAKY